MRNQKKIASALLLFSLCYAIPCVAQIKMKEVKCQSGETVFVPKNPDKAYQFFAKQTDLSLKATISILDKVKLTDIDLGTKTQITKLRQDLDNYSSRTEDLIKAAVIGYAMTPCDTSIRKVYFDLLANMAKENAALEEMKTKLNQVVTSGNAAGIDDAQVKKVIADYQNKNGEKMFEKK
ncbi:hypothetical protein ACFGVS_23675 [Mucilaginibacter sp. AW1-7]|uniref:hypothetical protein n=1 Tax=Mucilaginibacter sp. AW1-7 TaxID=3349874 RepID=UPI003F73D867